jgi:HSP20 family protein
MANNLSHFDPFGNISRMMPRALDEWLRDVSPRGMRDMAAEQLIGLEIAENDKGYTVRAEIPGVKKEDIKVEVQGNRVSISAESRRETEQKQGDRVVRSELYYGQQHRSFVLDQDVDESQASAHYVDGVLELTLPKKVGGGASKVQIS